MYIQKGHSESNPIGNVVSPMVVGGAIIAVKCKEGVIIANDTLLAYGGLLSNTLIKFRISWRKQSRKVDWRYRIGSNWRVCWFPRSNQKNERTYKRIRVIRWQYSLHCQGLCQLFGQNLLRKKKQFKSLLQQFRHCRILKWRIFFGYCRSLWQLH